MITTNEIFNILVVEDDVSEQKLIKMMIKNSNYPVTIKYLNDGEEAVNYFNSFPTGELVFSKLHLIFLDLNLPKINGIEVLSALRQNVQLKCTPVVVLTTSNNKNDVAQAYKAGAYGYVRKPSTIEEYEKVIKQVLDYWLNTCLIS